MITTTQKYMSSQKYHLLTAFLSMIVGLMFKFLETELLIVAVVTAGVVLTALIIVVGIVLMIRMRARGHCTSSGVM